MPRLKTEVLPEDVNAAVGVGGGVHGLVAGTNGDGEIADLHREELPPAALGLLRDLPGLSVGGLAAIGKIFSRPGSGFRFVWLGHEHAAQDMDPLRRAVTAETGDLRASPGSGFTAYTGAVEG